MSRQPELSVGDAVELRESHVLVSGHVVKLLDGEHVMVKWDTGLGYEGKTRRVAVRDVRRIS